MAEIAKKTKTTAAKPRKAAAKKSAGGVTANPANGNVISMTKEKSVPQDEVARLAHRFWQERGHKDGHHIEDWFRAEQELRGIAS
ncbi:MAG TPA: DUF2934 domain-containing protein [Terracidiphilus sp.]|jgi:hypothetical protein|nr:DUF2934 domain-containing protein [Terracidiphilus sp.]